MSKTKIFITIIAIVAIGVVAIVLISSKPTVSPEVSEETGKESDQVSEIEAPEVIPIVEEAPLEQTEYKIINSGTGVSADGAKKGFYDIVTGELTEEEAKILAGKIIKDVTTKDSDLKEISLLFYSNESLAIEGRYDVAQVSWISNEITVRMKMN